MGTSTFYRSGDLFGVRYEFDRPGDAIKMHAHTERDRHHNVIVLRGSVLIRHGDGLSAAWPGDPPFDITDETPHEVIALESGTVILNINLHGAPEVFKDVQDGEYAGPTDFVGVSDGL